MLKRKEDTDTNCGVFKSHDIAPFVLKSEISARKPRAQPQRPGVSLAAPRSRSWRHRNHRAHGSSALRRSRAFTYHARARHVIRLQRVQIPSLLLFPSSNRSLSTLRPAGQRDCETVSLDPFARRKCENAGDYRQFSSSPLVSASIFCIEIRRFPMKRRQCNLQLTRNLVLVDTRITGCVEMIHP